MAHSNATLSVQESQGQGHETSFHTEDFFLLYKNKWRESHMLSFKTLVVNCKGENNFISLHPSISPQKMKGVGS